MDKYSNTLNSKINKLKHTIDYMQKDIDQIQLTVSFIPFKFFWPDITRNSIAKQVFQIFWLWAFSSPKSPSLSFLWLFFSIYSQEF